MFHAPKLLATLSFLAALAGCAAPPAAPPPSPAPAVHHASHIMPDGTVMTDDGTVEPAATVAGEKPVSFRDQVVPVLRQHCATCHTAGGPGASYVTMFDAQGAPQYANVKDSIGWMLLAIQNGRMPKDAPNSLSKDEFDTLDNWAAADTPDN